MGIVPFDCFPNCSSSLVYGCFSNGVVLIACVMSGSSSSQSFSVDIWNSGSLSSAISFAFIILTPSSACEFSCWLLGRLVTVVMLYIIQCSLKSASNPVSWSLYIVVGGPIGIW